ncbi:MAG: hypothetical protein ACI4TX_04295 [Christensenellales bacterium]
MKLLSKKRKNISLDNTISNLSKAIKFEGLASALLGCNFVAYLMHNNVGYDNALDLSQNIMNGVGEVVHLFNDNTFGMLLMTLPLVVYLYDMYNCKMGIKTYKRAKELMKE